jgi:hypothetical protein
MENLSPVRENISPARIAESQRQNAALFTEVNELLLKTVRALWENQTEMFRSQAEHATKNIAPLKVGEHPASAISAYCDQMHERTEHLVAHMRKANDLVLDTGWQLLGIYTRGFKQAAQDVQTPEALGRSGKV